MTNYLFWYDASKMPQADKIKAACQRYEHKHGHKPTKVLMNAGQYDDNLEIAGVNIVGRRDVLPNHLQVGTIDNQ